MNIEKSLDIIKGKLLMIDKMLKQDQEEGRGSAYEMQTEDFEAIETLLIAYGKEKEKNKRAEELYMQHNQMIIDILKECDYMIKNRYYMNDIAIRQYAEKIKDIAKYYIKEPEWIEIEEE